jgi:ubiquinone/menaquinone biosynthesis C-methylase UbiE
MQEVNLLSRYPRTKRNITQRASAKTEEHIRISSQFGEMYFDGPREYGYGGYRYDGRWVPVAEDIIKHFNLKPGMRVLDVGCAKGFLVKDLLELCPGLEVFGIDISEYAIKNCEKKVIGHIYKGEADNLLFPDDSFDAVISINTIHNLPRERCLKAIQEIERIAPGRGYIQVDSYNTPLEREIFTQWVLTAVFHDYPDGWRKLFAEAGYTGYYYWTIAE